MTNQGRILLIEDRTDWQELLSRNLKGAGYIVEIAATFDQAVNNLQTALYHLAIIDIRLNDLEPENTQGMTILDEFKARDIGEATEKIMISAYGTMEQMRNSFTNHDVADFVDKDDFDLDRFLASVNTIFKTRVRANFDLEIIFEDGLSYPELLAGIELDDKRLTGDDKRMLRVIDETIELLRKLFYNSQSIVISRLGAKVDTRSGTRVVRVQPYYKDRHGESVIVKLGDHRKLEREHDNFHIYVKGFIGGNRSTNELTYRRTPWLGGIVYSLVGTGAEHIVDFANYYSVHSPSEIDGIIHNLFENTCAIWYRDRGSVHHVRLTQKYMEQLDMTETDLEKALAENFHSLVGQKTMTFHDIPNRQFINPVYAVRGREFNASTYECVTHGDLNGGNILIDTQGSTWLIDFASTGKAHILRDAAELETVIKFQLLESSDLKARAELETALLGMERFRDATRLVYVAPNGHFQKAFQTILAVREQAADLVRPDDDVRDYYISLMYLALNMLRFYQLHKVNRIHALFSAAMLGESLGLRA